MYVLIFQTEDMLNLDLIFDQSQPIYIVYACKSYPSRLLHV